MNSNENKNNKTNILIWKDKSNSKLKVTKSNVNRTNQNNKFLKKNAMLMNK